MQPKVTLLDSETLPMEAVSRGRVNAIRRKRLPLDIAIPGCTIEYSISLVPNGYFTPRHRHNFDQIRYTMTGIQSTGWGDLAPGECGYFPEGVYYGPQEQHGDCLALVLQYQGASGEHLLSNEEMNATYHKMIAAGGSFENGVYKGKTADGRPKNKDSYEAIWEEHEGRDLTFPAPRYRHPVMMIAANYRWVPSRKQPGVETRHLGTFTELETRIGFTRLAPGASVAGERHEDMMLHFLLDGSISYGGRVWGKGTYVCIPAGATTETVSSKAGAEFFTLALPMVAILAGRQQSRAAAE